MKPVVKLVFSSDIDDLENYIPSENDNFCFQIRAVVCPDNGEGEESIDFEVCTPKSLEQKYGTSQVVSGSDKLIVFKYDFNNIRDKIIELLESCEGETWESCGNQMSKFGLWEFENYKEYNCE